MANLTLGLIIGASLASSVGSALKSAESRITALQERSANIKLGLKLGEGYRDISAEMNKVGAEIARTAAPGAALKQKFEELKLSAAGAANAARNYGLDLNGLSQNMRTLQAASDQSDAALARVNARMARREERAQLRGSMMGMVGSVMAVAAPIRTAMNFEQSMAKVKAVTRTDGEQFDALTAKAKELGLQTQFSAGQAAEGMAFLGMASFDSREIIDSMPGMLDLAAAGAMDLGASADIASNILSGFGMKAGQMDRVADVLVRGFTTSNTNLAQLGDAMKYVAPVAAKVNTDLEETAAMVGLLGNVGIQGSMAGTALRAAMTRLARPTRMTDEALEAMGLTLDDLITAEGKMLPMPKLLKKIADASGDMTEQERMAAFAMLFGQEAVAGMSELVDRAADGRLEEYAEQLRHAGGEAKRTAKTMNDTLKGAFISLGSAVENFFISSATPLLDPLRGAVLTMTELVRSAGRLAEKYPLAAKAIGGVATACVGLKLGGLAGKYGFSLLQDGASYLWGGLQRLRPSVIRTSLEMLKLRGSGSLLGGALASVRGSVASLGRGLAADWTALKSGLGWAAAGMKSAALAAWSFSKGALLSLGSALKSAGAATLSFAKTAIPSAVAGIKALGAALAAHPVGLAIAGIAMAGAAVVYYWDDVKAFFLKIWEPVRPYWEAFTGWLGGVWERVGAAWEGAVKMFDDLFEAFKAPFIRFGDWVDEKIAWIGDKWKSFKETIFGSGEEQAEIKRQNASALYNPSLWGLEVAEIPGRALGGIFDRPHLALFAEDGEEAAIPLSSKHRARGVDLWTQAGVRLGMLPAREPEAVPVSRGGAASGGARTVVQHNTFKIEIHSQAPADDSAISRLTAAIRDEMARIARGGFADDPCFG